MGDLVTMLRPKSLPARAFVAGHSAEILFFTGVRYYRMDEAAEPVSLVVAKREVAKRRRSADQRTAIKRLRVERRLEALA